MNLDYKKYFTIIYNLLKEQITSQYNLIYDLRNENKKSPFFCPNTLIISDIIIIILWLFLISSILWMLYEIFKNIYIYFKLSSYRYFTTTNLKFADSPLFKQLENIYYLNDYFSIDTHFATFIITAIFVIVKLDVFKLILKEKHTRFPYTKLFCILSIFIGLIYYFINYYNITNLGKRVNSINRIFYTNINTDFINNKKICNYLNKKNEFDNDFVYGKCNDIKSNISINRLYEYIKQIFDDISRNHKSINDINIAEFKTLTDKNGKLYKDKIISALFTFQILKYFVDNDLIDEAKDFFSAFNMLYTPNIQILKKKINPILFLRIDNVMVFENLYEFEGQLKKSFFDNKNLFEFIKLEYIKIQNIIQKIVIDIYDICSSKLMSIYVFYFSLLILLIILIIIYQFYPKINLPFI